MTAPGFTAHGKPSLTAGGWRRLMWWKTLHPAAELTIRLLQEHSGWIVSSHHLDNDRFGVSMWIANRWYGFELAIDGRPAATRGRKVQLDNWSRAVLIAHVKQFLARNQTAAASNEIAAFAHRITRELTKDIAA